MALLSVVKMGNQQLATPSDYLENFEKLGRNYPGLNELIQNMKDTMDEEGGIGIAAPQIGSNLRVIMFGFEDGDSVPEDRYIPFTVLINPVITILSDEMVDGWEACLSLPGFRGLVPRYKHIEYQGFAPDGQCISRQVEGYHARVVQHENDHLEGILYPQRIKDFKYFGFEEAFGS